LIARIRDIYKANPRQLEIEAQLTRAEAMADLIVRGTRALKAGLRWVVARFQKLTLSTRVG
jgi:hypothetical protein